LRGFEIRTPTYDEPGQPVEHMVVLHVLLDCVDAMGANMVNTLCEALAPAIEQATAHPVSLKILSNLADKRLAHATVRLSPEGLGTATLSGDEVARRITSAWRFAWADPYRAATHNKGVMNGVDAVCIATGNDWRAVEAGAHAWCARDGQYRPLTRWQLDDSGMLVGEITLPLQLGTVGGPIRVHPTVRSNIQLMGNPSANELSAICAAVGLAQNLGALRALATDGIQSGHMRMHARSLAASAGAIDTEVEAVVEALARSGDFSVDAARAALASLRA
jgi:hydroxymethylglutaryl-CoA reductase